VLSAISYGGELPFDRAEKPRSLLAGGLTAEGSLDCMKNCLVLAHSTWGWIIRTILRFSPH